MEPRLQRLYRQQILLQCEFAITAYGELQKTVAAKQWRKDWRKIFGALQTLLTATANVSKALWGSGGNAAKAREPVRVAIGVDESSPLNLPLHVRNSFDHFDERLERWWDTSKNRRYLGHRIGSRAAPSKFAHGDIFRSYDPKAKLASFWNDDYDVGAIIAEIERILPAVRKAAK